MRWLGVISVLVLRAAVVLAQPAHAPAAAPVAPASPPAPGMRIAAGQAPVVGGNAADARLRALDEAVRQAVDQALAEIIDPQTRATEAKAIEAVHARARSFVFRQRTLEQGEVDGVYRVRLAVEIDEGALRRSLGRPDPAGASTTRHSGAPGIVVLLGNTEVGTPAFASGLADALTAAGLRARVGSVGGAFAGAKVRVTVDGTDEAATKGTASAAYSCHAEARLVTAPGRAAMVRSAQARVVLKPTNKGRSACVARLTNELSSWIAGAFAAP